jgi:hypothetical protein
VVFWRRDWDVVWDELEAVVVAGLVVSSGDAVVVDMLELICLLSGVIKYAVVMKIVDGTVGAFVSCGDIDGLKKRFWSGGVGWVAMSRRLDRFKSVFWLPSSLFPSR